MTGGWWGQLATSLRIVGRRALYTREFVIKVSQLGHTRPNFFVGTSQLFFGTSQAMCWDVPNVFWDTIDYMAWAFTDVSVSISISITVGSLVEPSHPSSSMTISLYYHSPRTVLLIPKGDTWYQSEEAGTASRSTRLTFGRRGLVGLASRIAAACFSRCLLKQVRRA